MGVIKIIQYIRLYGLPDILVLWTSYSAYKEVRTMDESLNLSLRVFALVIGAIYTISRIRQLEIDNATKVINLRIKEEELKSIILDNKLKEKELEKNSHP